MPFANEHGIGFPEKSRSFLWVSYSYRFGSRRGADRLQGIKDFEKRIYLIKMVSREIYQL